MNSSGTQPNPKVGCCTHPDMPAVPENWAARIVQARQSLHGLLHVSGAAQKFESILSHVSEHIPVSREKLQPRVVGWIRSRKSSGVSLKLRSVGWKHLCDAIDPNEQALVLTWGATDGETDPQWMVSKCPKRELPPKALQRSVILRLRELLVLIPQKEHLIDLNGRVLIVTAGELSIE